MAFLGGLCEGVFLMCYVALKMGTYRLVYLILLWSFATMIGFSGSWYMPQYKDVN